MCCLIFNIFKPSSSLVGILLLYTFFSVYNRKMISVLGSRTRSEAIYNLVVISVWIILVTVLLRYLWNQSLVKYITILKPVDSLWHTFVLAFALAMYKF